MLGNWVDVKSILVGRGLSAQYTVVGSNYWIKAIDGAFEVDCVIPTDLLNSDTNDFVTNFKSTGNLAIISAASIQSQPPYGSKTIVVNGVTKKLFARFTGIQSSVTSGSNTINYTAIYNWAKLLGVEAINCEALDTVDFKVYDNSSGTYSGYPNALLNQFGYTLNLSKDFYQRMAQFDADIYVGMIIQITYHSQSNKTVGINLLFDEVK